MVMSRTTRHVWLYPAAIWIGLLALLVANVGAAYASFGEFGFMSNLFIAALCVGAIGILFMNLARSTVLVRIASGAGIFWLLFLFIMTAGDYLTR